MKRIFYVALAAVNILSVGSLNCGESISSQRPKEVNTVTHTIKKYVDRNKYTLAGIAGVLAVVGGLKYYINYVIEPRLAQFDNDFASVINNFISESNDTVRAVLKVCRENGSDLLERYEKDLSTTSQQQLNDLNKSYIDAANAFMEPFKDSQQALDRAVIDLAPVIDSFFETDWCKDHFSAMMRKIEGSMALGIGYCWTAILSLKLLADSLKEDQPTLKESDIAE